MGFVGLYTAISFCKEGHAVTGVDVDPDLVEQINAGTVPLDIEDYQYDIERFVERGHLSATTGISDAPDSDVYVVSVPTPLGAESSPDLSPLEAAIESIAENLERYDLVVVQSTVNPGCCREVIVPALERSGLVAGDDFGVSYLPERYSPGDAVSLETPRIVSSVTEEWQEVTIELYGDVVDSLVPVSSLETAETVKHIENIQRDVNIALMNELHKVCHQRGIDTWEVLNAAGTKWNFHPYRPGMGVGGHCIPIDPYYFLSTVRETDVTSEIIRAAREVNETMPTYHARALAELFRDRGESLSSTTVAILGITYKPGVRDIRHSPAVEFANIVDRRGATTAVHDPMFDPDETIVSDPPLENERDVLAAVTGAEAVVVGTDHDEFDGLDVASLIPEMAERPVVLDPYHVLETPSAELRQVYVDETSTKNRVVTEVQ